MSKEWYTDPGAFIGALCAGTVVACFAWTLGRPWGWALVMATLTIGAYIYLFRAVKES